MGDCFIFVRLHPRLSNMMKKEYNYDPIQYFVQVILASILCVVVFVIALRMVIIDHHRPFFAFVCLVTLYASWNAFVSRITPSKVILEEDGITFSGFGKTAKYLFDEIRFFKIKDFRYSGKMFIRINDYNLLNGRYWVNTKGFNDSYELFEFLFKLEYKTHPDSIKAKAWDSTRPHVDKMPVLPWNLPNEEKES